MNRLILRKTKQHKFSMLYKNIKQEVDMKDTRRIKSDMEKGNFSIKTEGTMMEIGRTIKCMDGANSTIRVDN